MNLGQPPVPGRLAVVLVSGGMDSLVCAAIAAQAHEPAFLHLNYGQRTERRELESFHAIADHYGVKRRLVVDAGHLGAIGGSSLTDASMEVEEADLARQGVPSSYVPFRNANILSMAVSWAEVIGARKIFIGAVEEDSSGYPDCRREFYDAFNRLVSLGTRPETCIEVVTPVIGMRKSEIVTAGAALGAPFHLTWSCYQDNDVACGRCDSCALRLRAFREAGPPDPVPYAAARA
jgi:7-cyano-7-deazaguanine synthase